APHRPSHPAIPRTLLTPRNAPCSTPFPTRRSSDLTYSYDADGRLTLQETWGRRANGQPPPVNGGEEYTQWVQMLVFTGSLHDPRSEEHTSELQSRENLVCRLLLEKKKSEESAGLVR